LFRRFFTAFAVTVALALPVAAEDATQTVDLSRLATAPYKEVDAFVAGTATAVNQDAIRLKDYAQTGNCLELIRSTNSLALAHHAMAQVRTLMADRKEADARLVTARATQVRVVSFASWVRAEEWLAQRCRGFAVPAERASDPRYQTPPKVANADYTEAVIDARKAADTNLVIAVNAGLTQKCPEAIAAGQSISLLLPYIQKLLTDTAKRPEVLGPLASRRGLEQSRQQLTAALNKLEAQFQGKCGPPSQNGDATPGAEPPAEGEPAAQ
jgi:hypothetical protein